MIVRTYMTPDPVVLRPDASCTSALATMQERGFHHLPVTGDDSRVIGIVAERDLLLAVLKYPGSGADVSLVMHGDVATVRDDMPMTHAASLMARRAIGGLPVVDRAGRLIGMITETDIFRAFVAVLESKTARASDAMLDADSGAAPLAVPAAGKLTRAASAAKANAGNAKAAPAIAAAKKPRKSSAGAARR